MLKEVLEPLAVVSLLAAGVWFNRNPSHNSDYDFEPLLDGYLREEAVWFRSVFGVQVRSRNTLRFRKNLPSRILAYFPYIREVVLWLLIYLVYQGGRAALAVSLNSSDAVVELATKHGIQVLNFERTLGFQWENAIQRWFMQSHPLVLEFLNRVYSWVHITATIAFLGWLFYSEKRENYTAARRTLGMANLIAFVGFTFYACCPPRLLPEEYGFVDTVHASSVRSVWNQNRFQNQYAAMPSLHFGYSFIVGFCLFRYLKVFNGRLNFIGFLYPTLILVTIVSTANHYILDAIAGLATVGLAYLSNTFLLNFLILEDFVLYILHIHRPSANGGGHPGIQLRSQEGEKPV